MSYFLPTEKTSIRMKLLCIHLTNLVRSHNVIEWSCLCDVKSEIGLHTSHLLSCTLESHYRPSSTQAYT